MTFASELGLTEGSKIIYKGGGGDSGHEVFSIGEVITLVWDDGSPAPLFKSEKVGKTAYFDISYRSWGHQEEKTKSEFFNKKYKVNPKTSEFIQKEVFKAGGKWKDGTTEVKHITLPHLYVGIDGTIKLGYNQEYFKSLESEEGFVEIETIEVLKLVPQEKVKAKKMVEEAYSELEIKSSALEEAEKEVQQAREKVVKAEEYFNLVVK